VLFGLHGDILGRIVCRTAVRSGIDPEKTEVSGVARPFPVVGVGTILADGRGWGTYQPNVGILFSYEGEVLIATVKGFYE
jgi:hypothetical protein